MLIRRQRKYPSLLRGMNNCSSAKGVRRGNENGSGEGNGSLVRGEEAWKENWPSQRKQRVVEGKESLPQGCRKS